MLVDQEVNPNQSQNFEGEIDLYLGKEFVRSIPMQHIFQANV